ncbi:DUF924 family protein [Lysobacter sp. F6437]|uniref:DUF924 family protein n=1 Tax=Lysobacter sp. F6437 TaxID=3459296 RepID=UPI00403D7C06
MDARASEVVGFWREAGPSKWFGGGVAFDAQCRDACLDLHLAAARGELHDWAEWAESALALVLLLDQIPRNVFRGSAHAYATDPLARNLAERAVGHGFDRQVDPDLRTFFYLPFIHSEAMLDQQRALELYQSMDQPGADKWAVHHHGIIERFGRFPHRNHLLGRATSPAEQAFLDEGGFGG